MEGSWDRPLRYLTAALACLCVVQLAAWVPFYLTWPWFADHDVFATMALGWDAGVLPYRDLIGNNFPGTIYLFWALGKVFGWGRVPALYAADSAVLVALGVMLALWSRARFGRLLPGVVGYLTVLSYYLSLDYTLTAQRDWHAPLLVVLGLLAAQTWPNVAGVVLAALGMSAGLLVRPQVVLLVPALLLAVTEGPRRAGAPWFKTIGVAAGALALVGVATALGFVPLVRAGILDDFVRGVRAVAYGGTYSQITLRKVAFLVIDELCSFRVVSVLAAAVVLTRSAPEGVSRAVVGTWIVALAGILLYAPLSPVTRPYLYHPLWLIWSVNVAVLVSLILESSAPPMWQFLSILLVLGLGVTARPDYCRPGSISATLAALREGREPEKPPRGYRSPFPGPPQPPEWADYRDLLRYLRRETTPETRIANLLWVAITGPTARLPALPAESAVWLHVVNPGDEPRFVKTLEDTPDSVVVWEPDHALMPGERRFSQLEGAVRRLYRPEARFGKLEVWRRKRQ